MITPGQVPEPGRQAQMVCERNSDDDRADPHLMDADSEGGALGLRRRRADVLLQMLVGASTPGYKRRP